MRDNLIQKKLINENQQDNVNQKIGIQDKLCHFQVIQNEIINSKIGGVLVLSRSYGLYHIVANFLDYLDQNKSFTLAILLGFSETELDFISQLRKPNQRYPIKKIGYEMISKKRSEQYLQGGIFSMSITTLTFDILSKKVLPVEVIQNVIYNNIEQIENHKDQEGWICTLIKMDNPKAHILGISDNPTKLRLNNSMATYTKIFYVNNVFIWPNFRSEFIQSIQRGKKDCFKVLEFVIQNVKLRKNQEKIQKALVNLCKNVMFDIEKKFGKTKNESFFNEDDLFNSTKEQIINKIVNDKALIRNINEYQSFRDLLDLRILLLDLINLNAVEFFKKLQQIEDESNEQSVWKLGQMDDETMKNIDNLFKYAKKRLFQIRKIKKCEQQTINQPNYNRNLINKQENDEIIIKQEITVKSEDQDIEENVNDQDEKQFDKNQQQSQNKVKLKVKNYNQKYYVLSQKPVKTEYEEKIDDYQNQSQQDLQQNLNKNNEQGLESSENLDEPEIEVDFGLDYELKLNLEIQPKLKTLKEILEQIQREKNQQDQQNNTNIKMEENNQQNDIKIEDNNSQNKSLNKDNKENQFSNKQEDKIEKIWIYTQSQMQIKKIRQRFINSVLSKKINNFSEKESENLLLEQLSFELELLFDSYVEFHMNNIINNDKNDKQNQSQFTPENGKCEKGQQIGQIQNQNQNNSSLNSSLNSEKGIIQMEQEEEEEKKQNFLNNLNDNGQKQNINLNNNKSFLKNVQNEQKNKNKNGTEKAFDQNNSAFKRKKFYLSEDIQKGFKLLKLDTIDIDVIDELDQEGRVIFFNDRILPQFEIRINSIECPAQRQQFLLEYKPNYIILMEPFKELQREIDINQYLIPNTIKKVCVLMQQNCLESQIYLKNIQQERQSFEQIINESTQIPNQIEDPYKRIQIKKEDLEPQSTRQGGIIEKVRPRIIVDTREFRSLIPSYIFHEGYDVIPMMLKKGDIIISDDTAIERKAVETGDFVESVKSGRLDDQIKKMFESFRNVIFLIEWGAKMNFDLDSIFEYRVKPFQQNIAKLANKGRNQNLEIQFQNEQKYKFICTQIPIFCKKFPRLQILWSRGPQHTVKLIQMLKNLYKKEPSIQLMQQMAINEQDSNGAKNQQKLEKYLTKTGNDLEKENARKSQLDIFNENQQSNNQLLELKSKVVNSTKSEKKKNPFLKENNFKFQDELDSEQDEN
ncbi:Restriction endonuclease type II-like protein [Pseudocohnilembus persalinus]|uniref:Restriction endonuclease type II-like protein n=1 Tax=Pseudocohnilembus persalinus TaxID=266149 RepID=A0A0V0QRD2_PSEPJ|nr:Restriction endonuclease type II-like protein [Pseudocohnilembus persalinus]|eukprot:KRX04836.1 Restriction endonuclease type II-like protein [Pseudocohnilembus persalinus]